MYELRPYQERAVSAVADSFKEVRSALIVLATGCGKTIVFSKIAERELQHGGRVLILAHRGELLEQAIDKLRRATGIEAGLEKAESTSDTDAETPPYMVIVGSVQSMCRPSRLSRFRDDDFTLVIIDEAHHALGNSYKAVLDYFPNARLLGVTATPDRGDLRSLGEVFEKIAFEYSIVEAIKDGYLTPIRAQTIPLRIDISGVEQQNGDFQASGLGSALLPYLRQICREIKQRAADRKTIVFTPLIATSRKMLEIFMEEGVTNIREVNGESEDRKETLNWFANAEKGCVLLNSMLLCLDTKTEILTDKGFVGVDEITYEHKVANWNFDGTVFFEEPKEIVRRQLEHGREHMVHVHSSQCDFRVTSTHRMIVACGGGGRKWKKIPADGFHKSHSFPTCGIAQPFSVSPRQETFEITKRMVQHNSFSIRKSNPSMSFDESVAEAKRRLQRKASLRRKLPSELTLDECRLIGFWIADGSRCELRSGGVEYTLAQSKAHPFIVSWIDDLLNRIGFHYVRREKKPSTKTKHWSVSWSLPRGTGSGCQARNGVYALEPYLDKNGSELFWGLDERQFDAVVEGYWYGDGDHHSAKNGMPKSIYANDTKKSWIEMLCAIGTVRNWRCRVSEIRQSNKKHKTQYGIKMIKGAVKYTTTNKTKIVHEPFAEEEVWCVRTSSKNIITRRNGRVTVTGNTEGYDEPSVDCICVLRATRSRSLFVQMVGRGTRLCEGKQNLLLLDFLWLTQSHDLCRPACLLSADEEVCEVITAKQEKNTNVDLELTPETLEEGESETVKKREDALAKRLEEQRRKKGKLVDPLQFAYSVQDVDLTNYKPLTNRDAAKPTMEQIEKLEAMGFGCPDTFGAADMLIKKSSERQTQGLAAPKEIRLLERYGFQHVGTWTHEQARRLTQRIIVNGWRVPYSINPQTYTP